MGSGSWFRSFICIGKSKSGRSKQIKVHSANEKSNGGEPTQDAPEDQGRSPANIAGSQSSPDLPVMLLEQIAAARIQKAFRAYRARKTVRRLRDAGGFNILIRGHTVKTQTSSTLSHLHTWCNVQSQIRARRICMVTEGRLKQKRTENQLKLEAKLHELEVEWCGGSETMEEILSRIQQREEAAVKRERAMAYAFSHQWRANATQYLGQASFGLGKENWGWSWMERWIAARPWEVRVHSLPINPRKANAWQGSKSEKELKGSVSVKPGLPNGKVVPKVKKIAPTDGVN